MGYWRIRLSKSDGRWGVEMITGFRSAATIGDVIAPLVNMVGLTEYELSRLCDEYYGLREAARKAELKGLVNLHHTHLGDIRVSLGYNCD